MWEPVLDTVVLRVMAYAHPAGIAILLDALGVARARLPDEVYNRDEDTLPLGENDRSLSELARGLRFARQQTQLPTSTRSQRYASWLRNAAQLTEHLDDGTLVIEALRPDDAALRDDLKARLRIGRGEAAALALARRKDARLIFLSSDADACLVARDLGLRYLTLEDVLLAWVERQQPQPEEIAALVLGFRSAKYGLTDEFVRDLAGRRRG